MLVGAVVSCNAAVVVAAREVGARANREGGVDLSLFDAEVPDSGVELLVGAAGGRECRVGVFAVEDFALSFEVAGRGGRAGDGEAGRGVLRGAEGSLVPVDLGVGGAEERSSEGGVLALEQVAVGLRAGGLGGDVGGVYALVDIALVGDAAEVGVLGDALVVGEVADGQEAGLGVAGHAVLVQTEHVGAAGVRGRAVGAQVMEGTRLVEHVIAEFGAHGDSVQPVEVVGAVGREDHVVSAALLHATLVLGFRADASSRADDVQSGDGLLCLAVGQRSGVVLAIVPAELERGVALEHVLDAGRQRAVDVAVDVGAAVLEDAVGGKAALERTVIGLGGDVRGHRVGDVADLEVCLAQALLVATALLVAEVRWAAGSEGGAVDGAGELRVRRQRVQHLDGADLLEGGDPGVGGQLAEGVGVDDEVDGGAFTVLVLALHDFAVVEGLAVRVVAKRVELGEAVVIMIHIWDIIHEVLAVLPDREEELVAAEADVAEGLPCSAGVADVLDALLDETESVGADDGAVHVDLERGGVPGRLDAVLESVGDAPAVACALAAEEAYIYHLVVLVFVALTLVERVLLLADFLAALTAFTPGVVALQERDGGVAGGGAVLLDGVEVVVVGVAEGLETGGFAVQTAEVAALDGALAHLGESSGGQTGGAFYELCLRAEVFFAVELVVGGADVVEEVSLAAQLGALGVGAVVSALDHAVGVRGGALDVVAELGQIDHLGVVVLALVLVGLGEGGGALVLAALMEGALLVSAELDFQRGVLTPFATPEGLVRVLGVVLVAERNVLVAVAVGSAALDLALALGVAGAVGDLESGVGDFGYAEFFNG